MEIDGSGTRFFLKGSNFLDRTSFLRLIQCSEDDVDLRVGSRERRDLEFKAVADQNCIRKSVKTVAAFSNLNGGSVVFGVAERPRRLIGIGEFPDEARLQDLLTNHLYPVPDIEVIEHRVRDLLIIQLYVLPCPKAPVVAIKDLQTQDRNNSTVLSQGTIYFRRAGQTKPVSGEECSTILERRDEAVRQSILGLLSRAGEIGFESAAIADFRQYGKRDENVTLYVPYGAARELNIIDRAKLVESDGAPAYQIRGSVKLTASTDRDPRKPLLPSVSARVLRDPIRRSFWASFPWSHSHLRKAASHLGFWDRREGDGVHTGSNEVTANPVYFEAGRAAVQRFANRNPEEFVEVVGSAATKSEFARRRENAAEADRDV